MGLNVTLLLATKIATCRRQSADAFRSAASGLLAFITMLLLDSSSFAALAVGLFAFVAMSTLLFARWIACRESTLVPSFWPERFDPDTLPSPLRGRISPYGEDLDDPRHNLTVHTSRRQFVGFGFEIADWKLVLDTLKPSNPASGPQDITDGEVRDSLRRALSSELRIGHDILDHFFLGGTVLPDVVELAPTTIGRAPVELPPHLAEIWVRCPHESPGRIYLMCSLHLEGDLVLTHAMRVVKHGRYLTLEVHRLVLPPIDRRWAQTLRCGRYVSGDWSSRIPDALFEGPIEHALIIANLFDPTKMIRLDESSRRWAYLEMQMAPMEDIKAAEQRVRQYFRWRGWRESEEPMNGTVPDFGCASSVREILASDTVTSYREREELHLYSRLVDKIALDAIRELLKTKGISTDDFDEVRQTIVNSGVFIQEGNLNAASVSVGTGSSSVSIRSGGRERAPRKR